MLVVHHNDADGRCAAAIVWKWAKNQGILAPDCQFIEMDYNKEFPLYRVRQDEPVYIVDFSLKPEVMENLLCLTPNVSWCDHHKTAEAYKYSKPLDGYRDFSEKGLCGAECTWEYLFPGDNLPLGLRLLGDYDSWRLDTPEKCRSGAPRYQILEFYEGLKSYDQDPRRETWNLLLFSNESTQERMAQDIIHDGRVILRYRDEYCKSMLESYAYETQIEGHDALAANIYRFGSQGFGSHFDTYPICISYVHDGRNFVISFYSKVVDVSVIAKKFGGGGHAGASGCVCKELPFKPKEKYNG